MRLGGFKNARYLVIVFSCLVAAACAVSPAKISQEKPVDEINNEHGLALRGYDPVAYFIEKRPVAGQPDIATQWHGATYRFADTRDLELFLASPQHYAPQFGGYCAFAVSLGKTADGDPQQWTVDGERLFLNNNAIAQRLWNRDRHENIQKGISNWPLIPKQPLATLIGTAMRLEPLSMPTAQ